MPTELKPCPFCGRKPSKVHQHHVSGTAHIYYSVACKAPMSKCPIKPSTGMYRTVDEAAEAWNRRADDATD